MKAQRQGRIGMCGKCRESQDGQRRRDLQTREGLEGQAERWDLTQSLEASHLGHFGREVHGLWIIELGPCKETGWRQRDQVRGCCP